MACLEVESPTVCRVLQLRLQQRRTREQLVDQGIMPPLKTPAAFHGQIRSLERARTENFLKHKISSRPERSELVRMHILQETQAEPSLQATQMKLKRARLADDLNEKIALRPGPMELVEKNILPVESSMKETSSESETSVQKPADVYNFIKEARSPDGPGSQENQCSVPSPREARLPEISSATLTAGSNLQSSELLSQASAEDQTNTQHIPPAQPVSITTSAPPIKSGLTLVKQTQPKLPGEKSRSKKSKDPKPRVKKLKYHLYVPPDQKQEPSEAPMDSTYARLLQQQQQFLHLQILSQQQQHYSYQAILPAPAPAPFRPLPKVQSSCSNMAVGNNQASPVASLPSATPGLGTNSVNSHKPGPLPANLDEMKVAELKIELKRRGLPVSGTKTDLIERLKPYQESHQVARTQPSETNGVIPPLINHKTESMSMTPPVSPVHSELSTGSMEETSDNKELAATSPSIMKTEDTSMDSTGTNRDQSLYEKERQIEELIRKLEQEQRLVEELKMQLEVEKRNQQGATHPQQQSELETCKRIKEERDVFSSCTSSLEEEEPQSQAQTHQFYITAQGAPASQNILSTQTEQHVLSTTVHLPQTGPVLQTPESASFQQHTNSPQSAPQMTSVCSVSGSNSGPNQEQHRSEAAQSRSPGRSPPNAFTAKPSSPRPPTLILPPSPFSNHQSPKNKDPPRYEEAVKQTRALQATLQIPTAVSQHMDDLFDVLIESGEISPLLREDPLSPDKLLPVTASVTTLPINTALSRPPPQVHVAHMPSLVALASDHQLEALLDGTLPANTEPHTLRLIEELHSQFLEPPRSPMDTGEMRFSVSSPPSLHLHDTNLDNMDWLELTVPGSGGVSAPPAIFSSDFLDSPDVQWD
ncbi:myocardin-related transcription factor B isoform 2-T2 [Clarias gariepinus]|uniref:myocardin-related transcription factor B isoform X2 n=1 Tax=Clarias gariepinus TaxID=13013 RepID=UPI00234C25EF|nr:myocardin-related transcription factor B isoform X2 [Clarias gariepinus]